MKKIGVLTGGGDCPGLNAVIRGVTKAAILHYGWEVYGIMDGFLGMVQKRYKKLTLESVAGILNRGGTILGSTNNADPFFHRIKEGGEIKVVDVSSTCVDFYNELGLSALITLGGDGTQTIAGKLAKKGIFVVGVPKTIDKDVAGTDETFGFDSARSMVTDAVDRLHTTAASHHRAMVIEVMGRNAGWLALESTISGGADVVLIPEIPYDVNSIIKAINSRHKLGRHFSIIVVSEGARAKGKEQVKTSSSVEGAKERLMGISHQVAYEIEQNSNMECRVAILGHLQRGGTPTSYDRLLATRFAVKAMSLIREENLNTMVSIRGGKITSISISQVVGKQSLVPLDSELIESARAVGATFGD